MGNDAFFQALDVGCNAFMYLLHTWLSEKGRLIQFLFNKNHVIFFSLLFFSFFTQIFLVHLFIQISFIQFGLSFTFCSFFSHQMQSVFVSHKWKDDVQTKRLLTNKLFVGEFFSRLFFFCLYLLLLSEKSVHQLTQLCCSHLAR